MKSVFPIVLLLLALADPSWAQEKPRKTMTFQPGAKTPDEGEPAKETASSAKDAPVKDAAVKDSSAKKETPAKTDAAPAKEAAPSSVTSPGNDEPGLIATAFFSLLSKNLVDEAYSNLTKGSKIAERPEELRGLKSKTTEAIQIFGTIAGFELIDHKAVGTNLLRRTYVSLGRDFPLRWRFYFYRSDKVWRLVDLRVDDRLGGLFDEPEEPRPPEAKP